MNSLRPTDRTEEAEKAVGDFFTSFLKLILGFVAVACILMIGLAFLIRWDSERRLQEVYPDWIKLTGRTDITYEEFRRLKHAGHLKVSQPKGD